MNWDAIGAIGEIVGAAAVVVTLALLIAQLRNNSKAIQNAAMQTGMATNNQIVSPLFENEQLFELYDKGMRLPDELSRSESRRLDWFLLQIFRMCDFMYLQYLNGGLDEQQWESTYQSFLALYAMPGGRASWERQKQLFTRAFQEKVTKDLGGHVLDTQNKKSSAESAGTTDT